MMLVVLALLLGSAIACSGPDGHDDASVTSGPSGGAPGSPTTRGGAGSALPGETPSPDEPRETATGSIAALDPTMTVTEQTQPTHGPEGTPTPSPTAAPDPGGHLLPTYRIVSYYGHPNSAQMGILGEYDMAEIHRQLLEHKAEFEAADPSHPVKIAFELIATVAQPHPAENDTYLAWTDDELIQQYVDYATANDMLVILDLQIGLDTIENQIESVRHWIELPNVHIALDPEFSMKANETVPRDRVPGTFIGEMSGHEINTAINMIAEIVAEKQLPSKVLIVHQFENEMIYYKDVITPQPGVDFVLDMDGFGGIEAKIGNYNQYVRDELIQYGGIKLFFKQDVRIMSAEELVALDPTPLVIIYQ